MRFHYKKTLEPRVEEHRRYTTFTGAEVWFLKRNVRRNVRIQIFFCAVAWALGLVSFSFSEWIHVDPTHDMDYTDESEEVHRPNHKHLAMVSCAGGLTFMTGIFGYWGALHLEHVMVCVFSYIIFLNSVIGLSFGAVILTIPMEVIKENTMTLVKTEVDEQLPIFRVQKFLQCCGGLSPYDWVESKWWNAQRKIGNSFVVPTSCCINPKHHRMCNVGKTPFREVLDSKLINTKGCSALVLEKKKYLVHAGGYAITFCGLGQLVSFFAIHYIANIILYYQHRLDEIREKEPEVTDIRKPTSSPLAETQFERRMSMKV